MNIEGVKNDSKATPLNALPPPELASGQKLDASTAVLDYNDILQSMEGDSKRPLPYQDEEPPEEYYYEEEEEQPLPRQVIQHRRPQQHRPRPRRVTVRPVAEEQYDEEPVVESQPPPSSFLWKHRRTVLVAIVAAAALYFLTARLPAWLPRSVVAPGGGFSMIGMAIVAAAIAAGFFVGDAYVLPAISKAD
jgi:hypothetical protein